MVGGGQTPATLIAGLTIRRGYTTGVATAAGAGLRIIDASPTLRDLRVEDCIAWNWGGGIHLYASATAARGYHHRGLLRSHLRRRGLDERVEPGAAPGARARQQGGGLGWWASTASIPHPSSSLARWSPMTGPRAVRRLALAGGNPQIVASVIAFNGVTPSEGGIHRTAARRRHSRSLAATSGPTRATPTRARWRASLARGC